MITPKLSGLNPILNLSAALLAAAAITQITTNYMAKQDLGEILKLAQVAATLQAPQQQQEQQDLQTLMAMLNMQQQRQQNEAQLGLSREQMQLESQDRQADSRIRQQVAEQEVLNQLIARAQSQREVENLAQFGSKEGSRMNQDVRLSTAFEERDPMIRKIYTDNAQQPEKIPPALNALMREAGLQWGDKPVRNFDWGGLNRETWPGEVPVGQNLGPGFTQDPGVPSNATATGQAAGAVRNATRPVLNMMQNAVWNTPGVLANMIKAPTNFGRSLAGLPEAFEYTPMTDMQDQDVGGSILALLQNPSGNISSEPPPRNRGQAAEAMKRRNQR